MAERGTDIEKAKTLLEGGGVVAIPTETVYGLAAHALQEEAVAQIFAVKQRPSFDPLIVHLYDRAELPAVAREIPELFYRLYDAFCPGPLTFILKKNAAVPDLVTAGNPTVGVRFPAHPLCRELLQACSFPLAAPSANPFGYVSPTTAQHVEGQLGNKIPYILDGGASAVGLESTIVDLSGGCVTILRLGGISVEEIEAVYGRKINVIKTSSSNPKAPGMLSSHYAPGRKLVFGDIEKNYRIFKGSKMGSISFQQEIAGIPLKYQWILSPAGDLKEAAANLFRCLRETDQADIDLILAEKFPDEGLGRAINDRLKRASAG